MGQIFGAAGCNRFSVQEAFEQGVKARGWCQLRSRGLDVAVEGEYLADRLAIPPKAEFIAVCVIRFGRDFSFSHCALSCGSLNFLGSAPFPGALSSTKPTRALWTVTE